MMLVACGIQFSDHRVQGGMGIGSGHEVNSSE